jgi:hypothetical protein
MLFGGLSAALLFFLPIESSNAAQSITADQKKVRKTNSPTNIVDLQQFRIVHSIEVDQLNGTTTGVTLINLNPKINQWYILQLSDSDNIATKEYHLENPYPKAQRLILDKSATDKLVLTRDGAPLPCSPWNFFGDSELEKARKSRQVFAPLCNGMLYLRNPTKGHRTTIETVTDLLRDKLPGGEAVVGFVKDNFFQDAFRLDTRTTEASNTPAIFTDTSFPSPARLDPNYSDQMVIPADLGIQVEKTTTGMLTGQWYSVRSNPGIFVSLIQPKAVALDIQKSHSRFVHQLDSVEAGALAYLVAYDLDRFDLGFTVGTEHPRVEWSKRTLPQVRDPDLPGPDGIGSLAPLVPNGMINPAKAARTVATFTGGFKRSHGAFKYGDLARQNSGSHYGFIENGVVLSTLQPDLATLLVREGGTVEMKTWSEEDNQELEQIIQARQNGVPLIEWDSTLQKPIPGRLVGRWGRGNWSGSANKKLRTLRAGAALQQTDSKRFLIYGYFSTATPSAMARVFQAYGCSYAMHLDMNALEHTYLAIYHKEGQHLLVQHLIQGMSVLDKSDEKNYIPRFLGYSDNRDFFYIMKREQP